MTGEREPDGDLLLPAPRERVAEVWRQRAQTLQTMRARAQAADAHDAPQPDRYLIARSSDQLFAFPLQSVAEVREAGVDLPECPVPDAPPAFWSLVVVRGEVRPVFDARALLPGKPDSVTRSGQDNATHRHLLMLRPAGGAVADAFGGDFGDQTVGLAVDEIEQTVTGRAETPTSEGVSGPLLAGRLTVPDTSGTILIVDIPALLQHLRSESSEPAAASIVQADEPSLTERAAEESENR